MVYATYRTHNTIRYRKGSDTDAQYATDALTQFIKEAVLGHPRAMKAVDLAFTQYPPSKKRTKYSHNENSDSAAQQDKILAN